MTATALEQEFHEAMIDLYKDAKEEGYTASAFLNMVYDLGGLGAAKKLINDPQRATASAASGRSAGST